MLLPIEGGKGRHRESCQGGRMQFGYLGGKRARSLLLAGLFGAVACHALPEASAQEPVLERERERGVPVYSRARPEVDPIGVRAGAFMIYPKARLSGLYDDNIYATRNNREDDFITTVNPGVRAEYNWYI